MKDKVFNKTDDVITLFYILVKLKAGILHMMECPIEKIINEIVIIIQIREQNSPNILCKEFQKEFINFCEDVI